MIPSLSRSALAALSCLLLLYVPAARAADTTPPTLDIRQTWIEKIDGVYHFRMNLDPQDDVGVDKIEFRTALNTTASPPAIVPWVQHVWNRGEPFDEGFVCTAIVIEIRAKDAAGNVSPAQRRTFKAPFPISLAPNLDPSFSPPPLYLGAVSETPMDCKGLFVADFDGLGRDDILQVDNATGMVTVRRQINGIFPTNTLQLTAGAIQDSAVGDFDGDGRVDLVVVQNHDVVQFHNNGLGTTNTLTFSPITPPGRANSGITSVEHIGVADLTGDGRPDVVIVGTGNDGAGGSIVKAEVIVNDGAGSLFGFNTARGPTGASADRIAIGDITGDGHADVAMIDKLGKRLVVFKWTANGVLGGTDDPVPANQPIVKGTYFVGEALAIGDIEGNGHNDVVVTEHYYGFIPLQGYDDDLKHNAAFWQPFAYSPTTGLDSFFPEYVSVGPATPVAVPFNSDILIRDYTNDRFPELVIASEFDAGIRTMRLVYPLDNQNRSNGNIHTTSVRVFPASPHPQRLAAIRYSANTKTDVVVASGDPHQVSWLFNNYSEALKPYDLAGGASTDSDPNGTLTGGVFSYKSYPSGQIDYSLTYVNNTATAMTGATVECLLPATLQFLTGSTGNVVTQSGTSHYVRWTLDIPENSAGVVTFSAKVLSTTAGAVIAPTASLKQGAAVRAKATMPTVALTEPLLFKLDVSSDSDSTGFDTHRDEAIKYNFTVRNLSAVPITNMKMGTACPAGTSFLAASTPPPGTSYLARGKLGKETGIDWTVASIPPGGLVSVFVLVNVIGAENAVITESTAVCTRGTSKITAPAFKTTIRPSLKVELFQDKNSARPGDFIHYEFTVHNFGASAVANAKLVDKLPQGMVLTSANSDNVNGDFIDTAFNGDNLTPTSNPGIDRTLGILIWTWASIPARVQRTVRFTCQVQYDVPTSYYLNNLSVTNAVSNVQYNFVGTPSSGTRLFAAKALGGAAAASATAASSALLSTTLPPLVAQLSAGEPLSPPSLTLQKEAFGDGQEIIAGQPVSTVVNDPAVASDGIMLYGLTISNATDAGTATAVQVHDFIPTGMSFLGPLERDGHAIPSFFGSHFYDAAGKEIPNNGESFTDTNSNGVWNAGEPFTDANGNKKYDGVTAIRSFTFPVSNLAGGQATDFTYRVQTTAAVGAMIVSASGGMAGKVGIYTFDPVVGYHLTASNLNFPVNGGPLQLKTLVTAPAAFNLPGGIIHSRGEAVGNEFASIAIPLEVLGGVGLNLSNIKMDIPIPKGFLAQAVQLFDKFGNVIATPAPGAPNSAGISTLSFAVGALRNATAVFQVGLNPATSSVLKNAAGQIKAPLSIKPAVTGSYAKTPAVTAHARAKGASVASLTESPIPLDALTGLGVLNFRPDPVAKDAKIFVGRCAPAVVRRGSTFTYSIFVGNLSNINLATGSVTMNIPTGTTFVSASNYTFNHGVPNGSDEGTTFSLKPTVAGGKVTWNIGILTGTETGVVNLTVKVPDTFIGNRIDDNSCIFDVVNAGGKTPGPLGVVVLSGNETAQTSSATQAAIEGMGSPFNDDVRLSLDTRNFHISATSYNITTGGCDVMTMKNDVLLVPTGSDRVLVVGPADKVTATDFRLLYDGPLRIAAGHGNLAGGLGVSVSTLPGLSGVPQVTPNSILIGLSLNSLVASGGGNIVASGGGNIVASGGGNIVASGGGNLVASGGGNFLGSDATGLTGANAARLLLPEGTASLLATSLGGSLVASGGGNLVASGGGNLVASGGGNIVATGGGNLIGQDGASLIAQDGAGIIASGAGNLISQDGGGIFAAGAANIIASGAGNLINLNGVSSLANIK